MYRENTDKKTTKKSINANLPLVTHFTRTYYTPDHVGLVEDGIEFIGAVFADIDPDTGTVTAITDYPRGSAIEERHYHGRDCLDVSDVIIEWMQGQMDRKSCIDAIYDKINHYINGERE